MKETVPLENCYCTLSMEVENNIFGWVLSSDSKGSTLTHITPF